MSVNIHVKNFQSISDATLCVEGFTVVTGANNTGKSAVQRAVRGVFQNTPGTSYIREGQTQTQVTVDFGDRKVTWLKGVGKRDRPTYILDDGDPIFPGQGVPTEVAALGVVSIQAGGQELWPTIAPQFTGPLFLVDKSGSVLAEAVADVQRVGVLNNALRSTEGDRRANASTLKVRKNDLGLMQTQVDAYEGLSDVLVLLEQAQQNQVLQEKIKKSLGILYSLRDRLQRTKRNILGLQPYEGLEVPDLKKAEQIQTLLVTLSGFRQRLQRNQKILDTYTGVQGLSVLVDTGDANKYLTTLRTILSLKDRLQTARDRVTTLHLEVVSASSALESAVGLVTTVLKEVGQCPTCAAVWSERLKEDVSIDVSGGNPCDSHQ